MKLIYRTRNQHRKLHLMAILLSLCALPPDDPLPCSTRSQMEIYVFTAIQVHLSSAHQRLSCALRMRLDWSCESALCKSNQDSASTIPQLGSVKHRHSRRSIAAITKVLNGTVSLTRPS